MPLVIPLTDLGVSPTAALFEGRKRAEVDVSFFVTDHPPGGGPELHKHPYPEVFVVQEGEATFTVDEEQLRPGRQRRGGPGGQSALLREHRRRPAPAGERPRVSGELIQIELA